MRLLLSRLFGCRHRRTTFPLTAGGRTYVCCLSCGREFDYDWQGMRWCASNVEFPSIRELGTASRLARKA